MSAGQDTLYWSGRWWVHQLVNGNLIASVNPLAGFIGYIDSWGIRLNIITSTNQGSIYAWSEGAAEAGGDLRMQEVAQDF